MGSFYGGRRGASAQIVKTYNSYSEMKTDFSSSDCSVGYNEYVIVNENDQSILYKKTFTTPEKIGSLIIEIIFTNRERSLIRISPTFEERSLSFSLFF